MASSGLPPQLDFLTDAAHLLASTSPETSAYLMSCRNGLMAENDVVLSDLQKQHICTCCGHVMVPGQGSTLKIEAAKALQTKRAARSSRASSRQARQSAPQHGPCKVFTCGNCGRYTKIALPKAAPIMRRKTAALDVSLSHRRPPEPQNKPSANASSKKRAKNRKAGLQALLDQNKFSGAQVGSGLGLSLSDFMKK